MNKTVVLTLITLLATVITVPVVFSDEDLDEYRQRSLGVAPVDDTSLRGKTYKTECSSCHMAYPPGLLPASSWQKLMGGLDNHFGDNAELDAESFKLIAEYLQQNSADKSDYRRSKKIMRSVNSDNAPIRISKLPYIKREHHELNDRLFRNNPKVGSLSNCIACHSGAEKGVFNEHTVNIPGFGRWDD